MAQSEDNINPDEMSNFFRSPTFEAFFQVRRVAVNWRKWRKCLKKNGLHLKSTLARTINYDGAHHKWLSAASLGNAVGIAKHR